MKGDFILTTLKQKRGNGEGSWKKLGTNKWKVTITIGAGIDGKQIRRSKTGTKQECQQWYKESQALSSCNSYFYDYAINWLELRKIEITESTYRLILLRINKIAKINNFKMCDVNDKTLLNIMQELAKTHQPQSINGYISTLKQIFTYACENGQMARVPYLPKLKRRTINKNVLIPTFEEIRKILTIAKLSRNGVFYSTLLLIFSCGLRLSEVLALTRNDIDLNNSTITINKIVSVDLDGTTYVRPGAKTLASNRTIYVNKNILQEVLKYSNPFNEYILMNKKGGIPTVQLISAGISYFFKTNGYQITAHKIRHIFITLAQQQGLSLSFIATYVGHTLPSITFNTYTHIKSDIHNDKLDAYVSNFFDI